ncbi:helix-turn-helix domain-containing protein [Paenibacillus sp. AD87]|uniref:helix-turn-helix domain-containing protein n=1 Tax=Paenibacillus sp. AD87 TaxID=1528787 RepID=UPI0007E42A6E|nr:helix-turn-helix domain-containing protein [Paenibacillus sp. AD87]OAX46974.1 HTH-type transcriptional activator Btr [Paenibacillus sp. AD87]
MYNLISIEHHTRLPSNGNPFTHTEGQLLLLLEDGEICLTVNRQHRDLKAGHFIFLQDGKQLHIRQTSADPLRIIALEIEGQILNREDSEETLILPPLFEHNRVGILQSHERELIKELHILWQKHNHWQQIRIQGQFLQWVADVGERLEATSDYDSASLVLDALRYMEQNYQTPITRQQLAERAGFSEGYYSRFFKKNVGKSPQEYLTDIRMHHAKRLLTRQQSSIQDVAAQVGYNNPLYFSRIFKKTVGLSPTVYIHSNPRQIRVAAMNNQYTGHLLALGLEPCAATGPSFKAETSLLDHTLFMNAYEGEAPDSTTLLRAEPDLILTSEYTDDAHVQQLHQIAPTQTIAFQSQDWRSQFLEIAEATGRNQQAYSWLDEYDEKSHQAATHLRQQIGSASIVSLLVRSQDCFVAGYRHMGAVLYQDLQLSTPSLIHEQQSHYIAEDWKMDDLDADYIMLVFHPSVSDAEQQRWLNSPWWKAREAVKRGRVYLDQMNYVLGSYNAFSHDLLLREIPERLRSLSCM